MKNTISAIVTYYNLGDYLEEALESVFNQTYKDIEVILVNDGSTQQSSIDKLKEMKEKYKDKLTILNQENKGLSATRNVGIKKSKGKYIFCLDADDVLDATYIQEAVEYFRNNDVQIVTTWIKTFDQGNQLFHYHSIKLDDELLENRICVASVFTRKMWEDIGGYDLSFEFGYEDWDFWINAMVHGNKVGIIEKVLFYYRIRNSSMLNAINRDVEKKVQLHNKLYQKYEKIYQQEIVKILLGKDQTIFWYMNQLSNINKQLIPVDALNIEIKELKKSLLESNRDYDTLKNIRFKDFNAILSMLQRNNYILERNNRIIDIIKKVLYKLKILSLINILKKRYRAEKFSKCENPKILEKGPLVSVVIPCFNYGEFLNEAIESIEGQTFKNFEIILIDDCSTDKNTLRILSKLTNPKLIILRNLENRGVVYTRNLGIKNAKGKYILCLDADDKLERTYIEKCVWLLETNPETGVAYSYLREFGKRSARWKGGVFEIEKLKNENLIPTTAIFRKLCWEEVGGYSEYMNKGHEDWEFWISIAEKGWVGRQIKEELFYYRVHSEKSLSNKALDINSELIKRIMQLHPNIYLDEQYTNKIPKIYKKIFVNKVEINKDKVIEPVKGEVILLFVPFVIAGGAERLWLSYIKEFAQVGIKFLIISTLDEDHIIYDGLKEFTIGIFNLPKFLDKTQWISFINAQIEKYKVRNVIISNNRFIYENIKIFKELSNGIRVMDIVYNDSIHGYMDLSIKNDSYVNIHLVNNPLLLERYIGEFQIPKEKVYYLKSPVDLDQFKRTKKHINSKFVISYLGRFSEEKNVDILIDAISLLLSSNPNLKQEIEVELVGEGNMKANILRKVIDGNLLDTIRVLPFTDNPRDVYERSNLFVLISRIDGSPLSILEALAMDVPVLSSKVAAQSGVLINGYNSYVINEDITKENVADALKKIIVEKVLEKTKPNLRKSVEKYDISSLASDFLDKYF